VYILDPVTWGSSNKKVQMKRYTPTLLKNKNKNDAGHEEQKKNLAYTQKIFFNWEHFIMGNVPSYTGYVAFFSL
jgi:hypothetical protein